MASLSTKAQRGWGRLAIAQGLKRSKPACGAAKGARQLAAGIGEGGHAGDAMPPTLGGGGPGRIRASSQKGPGAASLARFLRRRCPIPFSTMPTKGAQPPAGLCVRLRLGGFGWVSDGELPNWERRTAAANGERLAGEEAAQAPAWRFLGKPAMLHPAKPPKAASEKLVGSGGRARWGRDGRQRAAWPHGRREKSGLGRPCRGRPDISFGRAGIGLVRHEEGGEEAWP